MCAAHAARPTPLSGSPLRAPVHFFASAAQHRLSRTKSSYNKPCQRPTISPGRRMRTSRRSHSQKRARWSRAAQQQVPLAAPAPGTSSANLPGGVLDETILHRVDAICQQNNCVDDGRGLAEGIAVAASLPRRQARSHPRTICRLGRLHQAPSRCARLGGSLCVPWRPDVICMFAQFEMEALTSTSASSRCRRAMAERREQWFGQCLREIGKLSPPPKAIAFRMRLAVASLVVTGRAMRSCCKSRWPPIRTFTSSSRLDRGQGER